MKVPPKLTVSIVLYKTPPEDIKRCIASLSHYKGTLYLYIVDNSPTDSLRSQCPFSLQHEYIHLPTNPGFGAAHNVAIRKGQALRSSYHLVINADVRFDGDVLSPMIQHMDMHQEVGHMMPKVLNPDGTLQRLCKLVPTPSDLILRRFYSQDQGKK